MATVDDLFSFTIHTFLVERSKKRGKNPNRVGANFDRKTEVDSEW